MSIWQYLYAMWLNFRNPRRYVGRRRLERGRELVPVTWMPESMRKLDRVMVMPNAYEEYCRAPKPILPYAWGYGNALRDPQQAVEEWAQRASGWWLARQTAKRRIQLRKSWGWVHLDTKEFLTLWSVAAPV